MSRLWEPIRGSSFAALEEEIRAKINRQNGVLTAYWKNLSFYRDGVLISAHIGRNDYFLVLSRGHKLILLDGEYASLSDANKEARIWLDAENVIDYVYFWHYFYTGGGYRFDIISRIPEGYVFKGKARRITPLRLCRHQGVPGKLKLIGTFRDPSGGTVWRKGIAVDGRGLFEQHKFNKYIGTMTYDRPPEIYPILAPSLIAAE